MLSLQQKNSHLMWRAGFGPAAEQLPQLSRITPAQLFTALQKGSAKNPVALDVADNALKGILMGLGEVQRAQQLSAEERRMVQQKQREGLRSLNLSWMEEMVHSKAQLREKMAFFWHGHFACRNINLFFQQQLLQVLRTHALGSFRHLLHEVSKSAAMLQFLNAAQNRKGRPNENFAREVMELFTMGRGHYTEQDIKEAARAFTGWSANLQGAFQFRKFQHDDGRKTILGKQGHFTGEEVLDLLLEKKETARYITQKIYRFFVAETVDAEKVAWLADRFYSSDYNIGALMQDIFTADWFFDAKNVGAKIKSPVELLAGLQRALPMQLQNGDGWLVMQRLLGQILFYPPNVAGWPGGKSWIDSTTLLTRMRLPQLLAATDNLHLQPKTDDDQQMGRTTEATERKKAPNAELFSAVVDWPTYVKAFENIARPELLSAISSALLQHPKPAIPTLPEGYIDSSSRDRFIQTATLRLMCLPEYQVC